MKQLKILNQTFTGYMLWQVSNLWQKMLLKELSQLEITHVQFLLLAGIDKLSGKKLQLTQAQLASYINTDIMMTSKVVRNLLKRGLIIRNPHPKDTRAYTLSLTVKGKSVFLEAEHIVVKMEKLFFSSIGDKLEKFNDRIAKILISNKST